MDVLPDFTTISDDELKALIERYVREEEEVSYRRRLLHGKIDILRAELVDRVKRREAGSSTDIFTRRCRKAPPAASTAEATLVAVTDPPDRGASGISVSPRSKRTCEGSRPMASAATCVITV